MPSADGDERDHVRRELPVNIDWACWTRLDWTILQICSLSAETARNSRVCKNVAQSFHPTFGIGDRLTARFHTACAPIATFCWAFGRCLLRAESACNSKARLPAHFRRSRWRPATVAIRREPAFQSVEISGQMPGGEAFKWRTFGNSYRRNPAFVRRNFASCRAADGDWGQQARLRLGDVTLATMPDEARQDHAPDTARPSATEYPLTLDDVSRRFEEAGLPRNVRTLQRYCAAGRLDCIKEETATGLAYFVDPVSVERAIKQLAQLHGLTDEVRHGATSKNMSHHVAEDRSPLQCPARRARARPTATMSSR